MVLGEGAFLHDDHETLVCRAEDVPLWDFAVVEFDVGGGSSSAVRSLNGLDLDTLLFLDNQDGKALWCLATRDEVVGEHAVSYPFLGSVDDIVLAILAQLSGSPQTSNIRTSECFRNSKTNLLLAGKDLAGDALPEFIILAPLVDCGQRDGHTRHVTILETSLRSSRNLLADNQVVEVIILLALDRTVKDIPPMQMLPRSQSTSQQIRLGHLIDQVLRDVFATHFMLLCLGNDMCLDELSTCFLQLPMAFIVVGRVEGGVQPQRLGVGNCAQIAGFLVDDFSLFAFERADQQAFVLLEDFVAVEIVEGFGGVLPRDLAEDDLAAGVGVDKVGDIVYFVVDDDPEIVLGRVLE